MFVKKQNPLVVCGDKCDRLEWAAVLLLLAEQALCGRLERNSMLVRMMMPRHLCVCVWRFDHLFKGTGYPAAESTACPK